MTIEYRAREALKKHKFKYNKSLGQNFLLNDGVIERIVEEADIRPGERVLEIGAGAGVLTAYMAAAGAKVTAIEIDKSLEPVLGDVLSGSGVNVVIADALKYDMANCFSGERFRVVANLPYYITTDIMQKLTLIDRIDSITALLQTEAANRIISDVGEEGYCALSALVRLFGAAQTLMDVPPIAFTPPPHVHSTLLKVERYEKSPYDGKTTEAMRSVIKTAFGMRRKTLVNNIISSYSMPKETAQSLVEAAGLKTNIRGEALDMDEIAAVARELIERSSEFPRTLC